MSVDPASAPVRLLQTSDGRFTYREAGSGPPLVFLHAGFLDHRMWEDQLRVFAAHHRTIVFDARGRPTAVPGAAHYPDMDDPVRYNAELASFPETV
ncbi:alpha/beta fold hydrolase [Streptomyces sp. NPDC018031]|uniref:alpha/beta fold hydrolase n=1 Tax=Streptomyces sp. NPDC018031 TaxID=3365033 RepID=UPI0037AFDAFC